MRKRIWILLLCCALVSGLVPTVNINAYAQEPEQTLLVYQDGEAVTEAALPVSQKITLQANVYPEDFAAQSYQWQIQVPGGVWVDIAGEVQKTINLTYGMVASLLDSDNAVQVRCKLIDDSVGAMLSNEVRVTVDSSQPLPELPLESGTVLREAEAVENPAPAQDETPAASDNAQETPAPAPADNADSDTSAPSTEPQAPTGDTDNTAAASADTNANADAASDANANAAAPAISDDSQATPAPADNAAAPAAPAASDDQAAAPAADADAPAADAGTQPAASADTPAGAPAPAPANAAKAPANDLNNAKADLVSSPSAVMDTLPTPVDALDQIKNTFQNAATTLADEAGETETLNIIINYVFENGTQAANPWTAKIAKGSSFAQDVNSPIVVGYEPDFKTVNVTVTAIAENVTYTVTYCPAEVNFTVKHYQQNVDNDNYTLVEEETKTGYTESPVGGNTADDTTPQAYVKDYEGFYPLLYDAKAKIAADGSTVVEIYYDRYYYLMNFDLDGGYGVEPIYARYGSTIDAGTPTKAGYTFKGWTQGADTDPTTAVIVELPKTMPINGGVYKAVWEVGQADLTVVFWYENANDTNYSYAGSYKVKDLDVGTQKSSDDYKNQAFNGRDAKHFTYNNAKAETVTVAGDGSTVLNVYYTRKTYTLTFKGAGEKVLTCTKTEHKHSNSCCKYGGTSFKHWSHSKNCCKLGLSEHTHSNNCYKTSDLTITAKYQADIHDQFPIKDGDKTIWWIVPDNTETYGKLDETRYLGSIDIMPGENITFNKAGSESGAKIYYYVETLNGASGDTTYKGKSYKQYKVIDLEYDGWASLTYKEEFHPITGFTQGDSNPTLPKDGSVYMQQNNYLYYTRNSYELNFFNYNSEVAGKGGKVQYEAPLSDYNFEPDYPSDLEANAYEFAGWYTTSGCYAGSEVNWESIKMPANDLILYAKWIPTTHTVTTWLTDKMDTPVNIGNTGSNEQIVNHGEKAEKPENPTNGNYKFVGWFYKENGTEKAFSFEDMPVRRDLDLYAKWSSNKLVEYTIRYTLEDGTVIASETKGSALAGTTKTFEAKTGNELNAEYRKGYFPKISSHSITMDIENEQANTYTFVYIAKEEVAYRVRYLEKGTNKVLSTEKEAKTSDAVVTETFVQIDGYAPDAYQKRLVLSATETENVITFWYMKDEVHAPVQVIHWIQNIEGDDYTQYQSTTDLSAEIDKPYSVAPKQDIPGFEFEVGKVGETETALDSEGKLTGTVTKAGLVLNLYYDRIRYPYEFRFLENGTNKELAQPKTGDERYQKQVPCSAAVIPGYTLISSANQSIKIEIENPKDVASKNIRIFYYTEQMVDIKYEVVGPANCGTLDNYQEAQIKVINGSAKGSAPTAADGFKFVGWYKDKACTLPVDADWVVNSKLTPGKTKDLGNSVMGYEAATYYAKFEYDITDLTISKKGCADIDENQSFIFTITGGDLPSGGLKVVIHGESSVTVKGLKVGTTYTVTEDDGWSWRYTPKENAKSKNITLTADATKNKLEFINVRTATLWLNGCSYKDNQWANKN